MWYSKDDDNEPDVNASYAVKFVCSNCGHTYTKRFFFGKPVDEQGKVCPHCKCKTGEVKHDK